MTKTLENMWQDLEDLGVSTDTLQIITSINGYNETTLLDVLYATTGYRTFEQAQEEFSND